MVRRNCLRKTVRVAAKTHQIGPTSDPSELTPLNQNLYYHSKPRMMAHMRLLKCFVLQHSVIKTKHLRSLVRGAVQGL